MSNGKEGLDKRFLTVLAGDVQHAIDRANSSGDMADRRNLIRTIVSAIEGISWIYRLEVLSIARTVGEVGPLTELAFAEVSFFVTDKGKIVEQPRFISTVAAIRMATEVAKSLCPALSCDFEGPEWHDLQNVIKMRNRITHPKSIEDLEVSAKQVEAATRAFFWLFTAIVQAMEEMLAELAEFRDMTAAIVNRLKQGDPDALALYRKVHLELDD